MTYCSGFQSKVITHLTQQHLEIHVFDCCLTGNYYPEWEISYILQCVKQSPSEKLYIFFGQHQVEDNTLVPKTSITSKGPRVLGVSYLICKVAR